MASGSPGVSVMLAIHEKRTTTIDLYRPLRSYVSSHYSEAEAQSLEDDLRAVHQMRSDVERFPDTPPLDSRRDLLLSYLRALSAIEPRFPISPDPSHLRSLSFTWYDAFRSNRKSSLQNIHFERAAVLFNLAAVYSQIAIAADRSSADGLRTACANFQLAAGSFAFLRDNVSIKASAGGTPATIDVSPESSGMLERLMLAQAQECFFEKVVRDGKPPALCSKIARQVALFYEEAFVALSTPPLSHHFEKPWISHVQLKVAQYYAEACYRVGLDLHEKEEIAVEIARLKTGINYLVDAKKSSKGVAAPFLEAVTKLESSMNRNLATAVKENEHVYLMRVPDVSTLPQLQGASLVKPTPLGEVIDATKERLFASLVPDSSAKALSRYTEMVDDVIRTQAEKLQRGSEMTRVRLKEMDLPDSILALEGNISLPVDLKEDVEAVQVCGGPSGLQSELQQLRDLRNVNLELLVEIEEMLQKEEREDAQFRVQFGTQWSRSPSNTLTKNLQDRLNKFAANMKQAGDSDTRIERALKDNAPLMAILDHRPIESALPSLARPIMSLDSDEDAIVGALKQSLRQLEALAAQRAGLEDMLKDMKRQDDLLPKLMATTGSQEDLFRREISKYDNICKEIAQNIEAQEQLLLEIQAENGRFVAVFNVEDYKVAREKSYRQISAAIAKYRETKENVNEGLKFYVTLQDAITNIKQQSSDFVMTRSMQCRDMIDEVQNKVSALSLDAKAGQNHSSVGRPSNPQSSLPQQVLNPQSSQPPPPYYQPSFEQPRPPSYSQQYPSYASQPPPNQLIASTYASQPPRNQLTASTYASQPPPNQLTASTYASPPPPIQLTASTYASQPSPNQHTASTYASQPPPNQLTASTNPPYQPQPPEQQTYQVYGQPAYPGWRGPYHNGPEPQQQQQQQQNPGSFPRPPYSMPSSNPPHQGSYYGGPPQ